MCARYLLQGFDSSWSERSYFRNNCVRTQEAGNRDVGNTERHLYLLM